LDRRRIAVLAAALSEDPREASRFARGAGFAGVVFDAYSPQLGLPELSVSGRRDFRRMLAAQEEELAALRVEIGPKGLSLGADVDRILARVERAMEAADGLGCRLICIDLGPLPEPARTVAPKPALTQQQAGLIILPEATIAPAPAAQAVVMPLDATAAAQVDSALIELGRRADRYGVTFAFHSELASFAALERALKAADCPLFAVDLDPVSLLRDEWDIDRVFSRLGTVVGHVRARDAIVGNDRRTRPAQIGQGSTNWGELFSAIDAAGFSGWITIDPMELTNRTAAATGALKWLRDL